MKLYIMKREALEMLKANLPTIYGKYYTEKTNHWISDIYGENPFIEFKDVPEFNLAELNSDLTPGEIDLNNCKILYEKLLFLSESQASDERLWAGLTHSTFYDYMRKRWGYGYGKKPKSAEKEAGAIQTRFFYRYTGRSGLYRNTLSKCWWVGHNTYDPNNNQNHFENLDIIGSNDLNSKINEFFYNFSFSSNPDVMTAIIDALRQFKKDGRHILVREHIRPAMSYLNAVGGSVVIDCLEKDEITRIFSDAVDAIMQGDIPTLNFEKNISVEEEDTDYSVNEDIGAVDPSDVPKVTLGCKVIICNRDGETKTYKYDLINGTLPKAVEVFTDCKVGDVIEMMEKEWKVEDLIF